jgi:3-oxoacyl-[acyl-carrier protein] reductase
VPTVIVTGAAQGLGRAYALAFAGAGWQVLIADINGEKAAAVAAEIAAAGGSAFAVRADVAEEGDCTAMVAVAIEHFGRIDALVNNAAITTFDYKPFAELSLVEWDRMFAVNVRGSWLAMRAVLPAMRAQGSGSIINVASNTYLSGRKHMTHYISSKGAIVGLTRATAHELGELNIRVNCVLPGATQTEVVRRDLPPERKRAILDGQALKRFEEPGDLTGAVLFLASDEARFITGQSLVVDGGFTNL